MKGRGAISLIPASQPGPRNEARKARRDDEDRGDPFLAPRGDRPGADQGRFSGPRDRDPGRHHRGEEADAGEEAHT
jgi:hypothetical protein